VDPKLQNTTKPEGATFQYTMDFSDTRGGKRPTSDQMDVTDAGNGMKIQREFFNEDSTY
jgi:hypothetical protein